MVANPDRTQTHANLDKLVPQLPKEALELFKYWTPDGYQPQLLSDWQVLMLRLLWHSSIGKTSVKTYKPLCERVSNAFTLAEAQSITIYNEGTTNGTLTVDGSTFFIKPSETHSWTAPGDNVLCGVTIDGTGTVLVVDYLEEFTASGVQPI